MSLANTAIEVLLLVLVGGFVAGLVLAVLMVAFGMGSASGARGGVRRKAHDSNVGGLNDSGEGL